MVAKCPHARSIPVYGRKKARGPGQVVMLGRLCLDCYTIYGGPVEWRLVK